MNIGNRLRELRQQKKISQSAIEKRTGLARSYVSRVENGHTIPKIETIEKWASALGVPLYLLLYDGHEPPELKAPARQIASRARKRFGRSAQEMNELEQFRRAFSRMRERELNVTLSVARKMVHRDSIRRLKASRATS